MILEPVAGILLEVAIKSTILLAVAWVATLAARRSSAAIRHLIWTAAFGAIIVLPFSMALPVRWCLVAPQSAVHREEPSSREMPGDVSHLPVAPAGLPTPQTPVVTPEPRDFTGPVVLAGLSGIALFGVQLVCGAVLLVRVRACADRVPRKSQWGPAHDLLRSTLEIPVSAMTWGLVRPIVMLPRISYSWPEEKLEAVVLHELAHVRRFDFAANLLASVACALYWFNPIVWLCARALRGEAESAADDLVLRSGIKSSTYADILLDVAAEIGKARRGQPALGVSLMKRTKIERRVRSILSPTARRRCAGRWDAVLASATAILLLVPLAAAQVAPSAPKKDQPLIRAAQVKADKAQKSTSDEGYRIVSEDGKTLFTVAPTAQAKRQKHRKHRAGEQEQVVDADKVKAVMSLLDREEAVLKAQQGLQRDPTDMIAARKRVESSRTEYAAQTTLLSKVMESYRAGAASKFEIDKAKRAALFARYGLFSSEQQLQLAERKAEVERLKVQSTRVRPLTPQDVARLKAGVDTASANLDRMILLRKKGAVEDSDVERARVLLEMARSGLAGVRGK